MKSARLLRIPSVRILLLFTAFAETVFSPAYAACNFAPVKQQIDNVLDKDAAKGAIFRREVADGADSITMIEKLIPPDVSEMADVCRFEVDEYLTKRGYSPFH